MSKFIAGDYVRIIGNSNLHLLHFWPEGTVGIYSVVDTEGDHKVFQYQTTQLPSYQYINLRDLIKISKAEYDNALEINNILDI